MLGVECVVRLREDLKDPGISNEEVEIQQGRALAAFVKRHLGVA